MISFIISAHYLLDATESVFFKEQERQLNILSQWALSSIREVRQIRLHLTDIFNKNIAETVKSDVEEGKTTTRSEIDDSFQALKTSLEALEKLASKWKKNADLRSLLPFNLAVSMENLDIRDDNEHGLTKVDWLVGRNEACRWLKRINHRIEALQFGLANCGRFLRNSAFQPLTSAMELTRLTALQMHFSVIDIHTRNPILYIKVGEVMHCLVTFGNLYMENVIVRSLDESHCLPGYISRANRALVSTIQTPTRRSRAMMELIQDPELNKRVLPGLLPSLDQLPDNQLPSSRELDFATPSRFITFRRITEAAQNAMIHFSNIAEPPTQAVALREFCNWLATYTRLYQEPCVNCGRLLGFDTSLPVLRTVTANQTRASPLHEHCRAEVHHRLSLELKPVKSVRVSVSKRIFEQLKSLQNDLAASMQEMVKSQKIYSEEEKQAHDTRVKAMNVEDKLRRRSTSIFNSMAQLHRNHVKLSQRRDECENRSAGARNEYLFQLTAINAHLNHYIKTDIPDLARILDGDVYDRFREVLSKTSETELEICRHHQDPLQALLVESAKINRAQAWENFIKESPIFSEFVEFQFEPRDGDTIFSLLSVNAKEGSFEQVAKKLARRFVTRERRIKSYRQEINDLCTGRISPSSGMTVPLSQPFQQQTLRKVSVKEYENSDENGALNQEYVENKMEELEFAIRREEIEITKIKACLELLKQTNVDVQAALDEAYLAATAEAEAAAALAKATGIGVAISEKVTLGASSSSTAATGSSSAEGSTVGGPGDHRNSLLLLGDAFDPILSTGSSLTRSRANGATRTTAQQLANEAWARATSTNSSGSYFEPAFIQLDDVDSTKCLQKQDPPSLEVDWSEGGRLPKATAMYEFLASRSDEINLVCNEKVVLLGTGDGEDWVKVRSLLDNKEGLVPRAFLSIEPTPPLAPPHPVISSTLTYNKGGTPEIDIPKSSNSMNIPTVPSNSFPSDPTASPHPPMAQVLAGQFVRTLIDFDGSAEDELSFRVGAVIHVLGRPAEGEVDDGWIEGELVPLSDTDTAPPPRGVFPSMLVEPVPAEESWRRRLNACSRLQSAKNLLSTNIAADDKTSQCGERRRKPSSSSGGSASHSRSSNSASRSKSRHSSSKRTTSNGRHRSTSGQLSSSPAHRQAQQQQSHHSQSQHQKHARTSQNPAPSPANSKHMTASSQSPPISSMLHPKLEQQFSSENVENGRNGVELEEELQIAEL
nr:fch and double sh3 domains protein 2 [Hymenolepis microstoma]